ncbi:tyrosine-type recombinase/integrase [Ammoniphilus sp. 3BR4]|uniref:tyrosine-type recombinase/integrase n=1 Tax=Ammoniphilus sp. 3BR4 TaxID=3158265 RepID=UPI003467A567
MKGSIKKNLQTGKWDLVVDIGKDPVSGKRKQKKKRGYSTKKEAEIALVNIRKELLEGTYIDSKNVLLHEYMTEWFEARELKLSKNTHINYLSLYKYHINPYLGSYKLQDLNSILLQKYVNELAKNSKLQANSIKKVLDILKVALKKAKKLSLIRENPLDNVELPRGEKKEMLVWDLNQVNKFINAAQVFRYYIAYILAIFTGMRKGEILGLRWKDIDFDKNIIYVKQILANNGKEFKVGAKTASGVRAIHIPKHLAYELLSHRKKMLQEKSQSGLEYTENDLVVSTKYGNPVDPASLSVRFKKQIIKLGLPPIRFHDLRHTHTTMLIQQNVNAKVISERLGHSSIQITLNQYSHVLPSMQQEVANKLDELIQLKETL